MLPFLIGFVVLAVGAASAYLSTTKTTPLVAVSAPPAPLADRDAILARLIKSGAKPSWGLIVPDHWEATVVKRH